MDKIDTITNHKVIQLLSLGMKYNLNTFLRESENVCKFILIIERSAHIKKIENSLIMYKDEK